MRTVEDLREALVSLEDEAPAVNDLLVKSSRVTQRGERRPSGWVLPAGAIGLMIAVVLGVAGVAGLRSGSGQGSGARHTTSGATSGPGRLLPFRLTSSLPQLTLVDVHSDATTAASYGTAVVAEYGMEVTIDVRIAGGHPARSAAASPTNVSGVRGWIDASCGVRDAPSSAAPSGSSAATSTPPAFNPGCSLTFDSGPWQVAIYVAGPGGGSRPITPGQFLQIGNRLKLAVSSGDPSTWFGSTELVPN